METFTIIPEKTGTQVQIKAVCFIVKDYGIYFYNKEASEVSGLDTPVGYCSTDCIVAKL